MAFPLEPETLILPPTPTPPVTTNAPVELLVLDVEFANIAPPAVNVSRITQEFAKSTVLPAGSGVLLNKYQWLSM